MKKIPLQALLDDEQIMSFMLGDFAMRMKGRELLAKKLLTAVNNGTVYFRFTDTDKDWTKLTPYSLLANTFENAEFKFEIVLSYKDIEQGKLL